MPDAAHATPPSPDAPPSRASWPPWAFVALWAAAKIPAALVAWRVAPYVRGDVLYYHRSLEAMGATGASGTLVEYPAPVVWLLQVPRLAGGGENGYLVAFGALMLAIDAAFCLLLWRWGGRRGGTAVLCWVAFTTLLGPVCWLRFDMVPAVCAGVAVLALWRGRPAAAGTAVAVGAAAKLWPVLLAPSIAVRRGDRGRAAAGVLGTLAVLGLASLAWAGWDRLVSPLRWQSGRGLQIESVWATPAMIARLFDPSRQTVGQGAYHSIEITGPGTSALASASTVAMAAGVALIAVLHLLAYRRPPRTAEDAAALAALLMTLVVGIMIVSNKAFSPQYILWLGGPLAALVALREPPAGGGPVPAAVRRALAAGGLVLAGLTQVVFPLLYDPLWLPDQPLRPVATAALALRNAALVAFVAGCTVALVRATRARRDGVA